MAIRIRRGNQIDFDKNKLVQGELAIVLDAGELHFCYGAGNTKRLATKEDLQEMLNASETSYSALLQLIADLETNPSEITNILNNISALQTGKADLVNGKVPEEQLPEIASSADKITYDNAESGLVSTDTQGAIDEVSSQLADITNNFNDLFINVKDYGAKLDGVTDDTLAIQSALDTGKSIYIPDGVGMIQCDRVTIENPADDTVAGLIPKSNQMILFSPNAKLKAIPNDAPLFHAIFGLQDVENVTIVNATLEGERYQHLRTTGEWGYGISIHHCKDITLINCKTYDWWGDGIIVGPTSHLDRATISKNIYLINCKSYNNRRQGLSVTGCEHLVVDGGEYSSTNGTAPMAGIDFEPNDTITQNTNCVVKNARLVNNTTYGIMVEEADNLLIENCYFSGNGQASIHSSVGGHSVTLKNCLFDGEKKIIHLQSTNFTRVVNFIDCKMVLKSNSHFTSLSGDDLGVNGELNFVKNTIEYVDTSGISLFVQGSLSTSDYFSRFIENKVIIPSGFLTTGLQDNMFLIYAQFKVRVAENTFINKSSNALKIINATSQGVYGKPNIFKGDVNEHNGTCNGDKVSVNVGAGTVLAPNKGFAFDVAFTGVKVGDVVQVIPLSEIPKTIISASIMKAGFVTITIFNFGSVDLSVNHNFRINVERI